MKRLIIRRPGRRRSTAFARRCRALMRCLIRDMETKAAAICALFRPEIQAAPEGLYSPVGGSRAQAIAAHLFVICRISLLARICLRPAISSLKHDIAQADGAIAPARYGMKLMMMRYLE